MMTLIRRSFLAVALMMAASPALAQATAEPAAAVAAPAPVAERAAPAPHPMGKIIKVKLTTAAGDIVIELYPDKAPITVANWLRYVDAKRYDNMSFYRASHPPGRLDYGVIQSGLENDPAKIFKPITLEPTSKTGLKHETGSISMARHAPNSATSDFFIVIGESPYLDAKSAEDPGFATFGKVVEGMDVVLKILASPTSPTKGVGVMKGQMLEPRIKVLTARRIP